MMFSRPGGTLGFRTIALRSFGLVVALGAAFGDHSGVDPFRQQYGIYLEVNEVLGQPMLSASLMECSCPPILSQPLVPSDA